jgi:hypothetical protein
VLVKAPWRSPRHNHLEYSFDPTHRSAHMGLEPVNFDVRVGTRGGTTDISNSTNFTETTDAYDESPVLFWKQQETLECKVEDMKNEGFILSRRSGGA